MIILDFDNYIHENNRIQLKSFYEVKTGKIMGIKPLSVTLGNIDPITDNFSNIGKEKLLTELAQYLYVNQNIDIKGLRIQDDWRKENYLQPRNTSSVNPQFLSDVLDKLPELECLAIWGKLCNDLSTIRLPLKLQALQLMHTDITNPTKLPKLPKDITTFDFSYNNFTDLNDFNIPLTSSRIEFNCYSNY